MGRRRDPFLGRRGGVLSSRTREGNFPSAVFVTERGGCLHYQARVEPDLRPGPTAVGLHAVGHKSVSRAEASGSAMGPAAAAASFANLYEEHLGFVWRTVRRLGIPPADVDDVVQDVFVIVHRKLPTFEGRAQVRTWILAILRRIVRDRRRSLAARLSTSVRQIGELPEGPGLDPERALEHAQAIRTLYGLLDTLDDDKRETFVLVELEAMSVPEVAEAIGVNINTVYARLRAARQHLTGALRRHRACEAALARGRKNQ